MKNTHSPKKETGKAIGLTGTKKERIYEAWKKGYPMKHRLSSMVLFLILFMAVLCLARPVNVHADSLKDWAIAENYKFTVNGKAHKSWKYHQERELWSGEEMDIFCIDGQYITYPDFDCSGLYRGAKKFSPETMSREKLTKTLYKNHKDEMDKGLEAFLKAQAEYGDEYDEVKIHDLLYDNENQKWAYYNLLTNYCNLNDAEKVRQEIRYAEIKINDTDFRLTTSDKEQTVRIEIMLNGKPVKDDKNYFYQTKVTGSGSVILSSFGEPVSLEDGYDDPAVKYSNGNITLPAYWTGLIKVEFARFETGAKYTYDVLYEYIYVSGEVGPKENSLKIYEKEEHQIELTGNTDKITYKVSDPGVLKVDKNGLITGLKAGKASVIIYRNKKAAASVNVTVYASHLMTTRLMLGVKEKHKLVLRGADAKITSAVSSDSRVAKVTKKGVITAKKKGTATVTVTDSAGKKYTCKVYVWLTADEVLERIANDPDYQANPLGSVWGFGSYYKGWQGGKVNPGTGACNGYAALISDAIMDDATAYYYDDPYGLLPGDIVNIKNDEGGHYITIVAVDYSAEKDGVLKYLIFNGNVHFWGNPEGYATEEYYSLGDYEEFECWYGGCYGIKSIISRYNDNIYKTTAQ